MVSLLVHAALALGTVWLIVRANPAVFRAVPDGPRFSGLEVALYIQGVLAILAGIAALFVTETNPRILARRAGAPAVA